MSLYIKQGGKAFSRLYYDWLYIVFYSMSQNHDSLCDFICWHAYHTFFGIALEHVHQTFIWVNPYTGTLHDIVSLVE
jgi:hypothetical protein